MDYENFKALVIGHSLVWFYRETDLAYEFETYEGPLIFRCEIRKNAYSIPGWTQGSDDVRVADFEDNHKAGATNVS